MRNELFPRIGTAGEVPESYPLSADQIHSDIDAENAMANFRSVAETRGGYYAINGFGGGWTLRASL
jgi:hypothetical protein